MIELLTTSEVAAVLGVSRERVHQLASREDFPAPCAVTRGVRRERGLRLWLPEDIDRWAELTGRKTI